MPGMTNGQVVIKKYANRRLYDTNTSSYITLDDLCTMVKNGVDFIVIDAKTEEDLTRQVLTQIIFDQESKGYSMLPIKFLRTIIGFYGGRMQKFLPSYLEATMENFTVNQDRMFDYFSRNSTFSPFSQFEEIGKQNFALFTKAFSMFNPFDATAKEAPQPEAETEAEESQQRKVAGKK
ncbi:MAG TPA: polyhydroxyalkanoate synthesis repressor PhaR [Rickettsiales bacterium]|nr:polyhydroxyalkanoate synthesis repressor PhaR [Rickettsiales bacterium]